MVFALTGIVRVQKVACRADVATDARDWVDPTSAAGSPASCPGPGRPSSEDRILPWSCSAGTVNTDEAITYIFGDPPADKQVRYHANSIIFKIKPATNRSSIPGTHHTISYRNAPSKNHTRYIYAKKSREHCRIIIALLNGRDGLLDPPTPPSASALLLFCSTEHWQRRA